MQFLATFCKYNWRMRTDVRAQKMEIAWWGGQFYTKVCSSFIHLKEAKEAQEGLDAHVRGKNRPHEKKNFDSVQLLLIKLALALQIFSIQLSMIARWKKISCSLWGSYLITDSIFETGAYGVPGKSQKSFICGGVRQKMEIAWWGGQFYTSND